MTISEIDRELNSDTESEALSSGDSCIPGESDWDLDSCGNDTQEDEQDGSVQTLPSPTVPATVAPIAIASAVQTTQVQQPVLKSTSRSPAVHPQKSRSPPAEVPKSTRRILPDPLVHAVRTSKSRSSPAEVPQNPPRSTRPADRSHVANPPTDACGKPANLSSGKIRRLLSRVTSAKRSPVFRPPTKSRVPVRRSPAVRPPKSRSPPAEVPQSARRSPAVRPPKSRSPPAEVPQSARRSPAVRPPKSRSPPAEVPQSARRSPAVRPPKSRSPLAEVPPPKQRSPHVEVPQFARRSPTVRPPKSRSPSAEVPQSTRRILPDPLVQPTEVAWQIRRPKSHVQQPVLKSTSRSPAVHPQKSRSPPSESSQILSSSRPKSRGKSADRSPVVCPPTCPVVKSANQVPCSVRPPKSRSPPAEVPQSTRRSPGVRPPNPPRSARPADLRQIRRPKSRGKLANLFCGKIHRQLSRASSARRSPAVRQPKSLSPLAEVPPPNQRSPHVEVPQSARRILPDLLVQPTKVPWQIRRPNSRGKPANLSCGKIRRHHAVRTSKYRSPPAESSQILSSSRPKSRGKSADRSLVVCPPTCPVVKSANQVPCSVRPPKSTRLILPDPLVSAVGTSKFRSPLAEVPLPTPRSPPAESFGSSRQVRQPSPVFRPPAEVHPPNPPRSSRLRSRHVEVPQSSRRSSAADTTQSARRILRVLSSRSRNPPTEVPRPTRRILPDPLV
ncbi:serine/arginine repetitive matrix protein 1-like [Homalodisca vitripennis]|uniref:serine/arginine repetitive matrix protein 1-like n=1 Tax=Homalodisca vitripennis TaxID=197043 RepID=UPI001EECA88F|nr:serine/arginine repetitive matrix protein 1-like [Homalodisca vitripennis]